MDPGPGTGVEYMRYRTLASVVNVLLDAKNLLSTGVYGVI